jgi:hypothetical protein
MKRFYQRYGILIVFLAVIVIPFTPANPFWLLMKIPYISFFLFLAAMSFIGVLLVAVLFYIIAEHITKKNKHFPPVFLTGFLFFLFSYIVWENMYLAGAITIAGYFAGYIAAPLRKKLSISTRDQDPS